MHAIHHATSGNLDRRGFGDVTTLTVQEYKDLPRFQRFAYRLYRNPLVLFFVGVPYHFIIGQRIPWGQPHPFKKVWRSILSLDLAIVLIYGIATPFLGWEPALGALLIFVLASGIGGWLFFVQHQFEDTYWAAEEEGWDFPTAAVLGSSYYHLPRVLQWFTGNIGFHHIHHLCGKIPNYRLQECFEGSDVLQKAGRVTFFESLKCARLALWDEDTSRLVRFNHLKAA
jgi:omega-6 fatty acid desaturase (delta-12 desaturase)